MARLPVPGADDGVWGELLNEYLSEIHNADGTLKENVVTSDALAPNAIQPTSLQDSSISETKLATTNSPTTGDILSWSGTSLAWTAPALSPVDATTSVKGIIQLSGDLGGTASSPLVPGLSGKADSVHTHTIAQLTDLMAELRKVDAVAFYSSGTYPLRNSVTSDALRRVRWVGPTPPPIGGGYAVDDLDIWELV